MPHHLLDEKSRGLALTNYRGFVSAAFTDLQGRGIHQAEPRQPLRLTVRFLREKSDGTPAEPIDIRGGQEAPRVQFRLSIDPGEFEVRPDGRTIEIGPADPQPIVFDAAAPSAAGKHRLFVHVFQRTQLIQVVAPILRVRGRP